MKKIKKTIEKEYNPEGKLIKHLETIIEEYEEEEAFTTIQAVYPYPQQQVVTMYAVNIP